MKQYNKETIERICNIKLNLLAKKNAVADSYDLMNFIVTTFPDIEENEYAMEYCANKIKESLNEQVSENHNN